MNIELGIGVQYLVIALAVIASVASIVRRQFPQQVRKLRIAAAIPLLRTGRAPLVARVGRWIAPLPQSADSGCGTCNGCSPGG